MKEEGFFKLWQGMSPAIYRHVVYSGVRMTFYEYIRDDIIGKNRVEKKVSKVITSSIKYPVFSLR